MDVTEHPRVCLKGDGYDGKKKHEGNRPNGNMLTLFHSLHRTGACMEILFFNRNMPRLMALPPLLIKSLGRTGAQPSSEVSSHSSVVRCRMTGKIWFYIMLSHARPLRTIGYHRTLHCILGPF